MVPDNSIVLMGCGDVGPIHEPMNHYATLARPTLATADLRFGQCERLYSERPPPPNCIPDTRSSTAD